MPNARRTCFVDTTLLIYAVDPASPRKREVAADLLRAIVRGGTLVLSAQSLNEFYRVTTDRRSLLSRADARADVGRLARFCTAPYGFDVTRCAWQIQDDHGFSFWDCVLLASAVLAGCQVFFSEDMQHGRRINELVILNPFETGAGYSLTE